MSLYTYVQHGTLAAVQLTGTDLWLYECMRGSAQRVGFPVQGFDTVTNAPIHSYRNPDQVVLRFLSDPGVCWARDCNDAQLTFKLRGEEGIALVTTTTGRLSSREPNLQNIPVRTQEAKDIRDALFTEQTPRRYR